MANEGLIRLKDKKPDAKIIGVCVPEEHAEVKAQSDRLFKTVGEVAEEEGRREREVAEKKKEREEKMEVEVVWKPRGSVVPWFENMGLE